MATANLNLDTLTASQTDKTTSVNNALERIDDLLGDVVERDISASGLLTLTADESERTRVLRLTGTLTADTTVRFASNTRRTPMILWRDGSNAGFTLTVQNASVSTGHLVGEVRLRQNDIVQVQKTSNAVTEEGTFPTGEPMVYVPATLLGSGAAVALTSPADDLTFVDSNPDTITRTVGSFVTDGFQAGMRIVVSGTASNDGEFTVATVAALTLTLVAADAVVAEGPVATTIALVPGIGQGGSNPLRFAASEVVFRQVFSRARVIFKSALEGSEAFARISPTAQSDFDVVKVAAADGAETSVGTVRFAINASTATFIAASDVDFLEGDVMEMRAPAASDAKLAEVHVELRGYRH